LFAFVLILASNKDLRKLKVQVSDMAGDSVKYTESLYCIEGNEQEIRNSHSWVPAGGPVKGVIAIAHGILEHGLAYDECAKMLANNGYAVHAMDFKGHGLSSGKRAWIDDYHEFVDDFVAFAALVRNKHDLSLPFFVFGHSMGSMVTHIAVNKIPGVRAMLISGFPVHDGPGASSLFGIRSLYFVSQLPITPWLAKQLAWIAPEADTAPLSLECVTSDVGMREKFRNDNRRPRGFIINKTAAALKDMQAACIECLPTITLPIKYIHGEKDEIGYYSGSKFAYASVATVPEYKSVRVFKDLKHECINEVQPARSLVYADILDFFNHHARFQRTGSFDQRLSSGAVSALPLPTENEGWQSRVLVKCV